MMGKHGISDMSSSKARRSSILNMLGISVLLGILAALILGYLYDRFVQVLVMALGMAFSVWIFNSVLVVFLTPKLTAFPRREKLLIEVIAFFIASLIGFLIPLFIFSKIYSFDIFQGKTLIVNLVLLLFLYVMISGLVFSFRFHKEIKEREAAELELKTLSAEAELRSLKSQIRPHFLFNTLHSISALVTRDPQAARRLIARLSDLLRVSLENRDKTLVPLRQELDFAHNYLEILKIRFGRSLVYQETIDPEILNAPFPAMVLQPLLENSVKHGLADAQAEVHILLTARQEGGRIQCVLRNNVAGGGSKEPGGKISSGTGLANIRKRLDLLYRKGYVFEAGETNPATFEIRLSIPFDKGTF